MFWISCGLLLLDFVEMCARMYDAFVFSVDPIFALGGVLILIDFRCIGARSALSLIVFVCF